jgi:putative tricarboxylic transport membrane protein
MKKFEYEAAPLILAMVLGPMMENSLRQSLIMANGSAAIFFTRPISLTVALLVLVLLILPMLPWVKKKREVIAEIVE